MRRKDTMSPFVSRDQCCYFDFAFGPVVHFSDNYLLFVQVMIIQSKGVDRLNLGPGIQEIVTLTLGVGMAEGLVSPQRWRK
jgi:hypothetical protein